MLTQERLKEILHYCPEIGAFTWLKSMGRCRAGGFAGCKDLHGYIMVGIDKKLYAAHRLAFLYMTGSLPKDHTDHINQVRHDNRWKNIREVTQAGNNKNKSVRKDNKSGFNGVYWCKHLNKWVSQIGIDGKIISLGNFMEKSDAIEARKAANIKYGFHTNHGN